MLRHFSPAAVNLGELMSSEYQLQQLPRATWIPLLVLEHPWRTSSLIQCRPAHHGSNRPRNGKLHPEHNRDNGVLCKVARKLHENDALLSLAVRAFRNAAEP